MSKASKNSPPSVFDGVDVLKTGKKAEISTYLAELHEELQNMPQDIENAPKGLHTVSNTLIQAKYLENSDREIRLLVSCCIVDILRIFAPEAPYKDQDMLRAFEQMTKFIRALSTTDADSPTGKSMLYILKSISSVKSCLVPVMLAQKGVSDADEAVLDMFDAVMSIVSPGCTEEVSASVCDVLQSCIEEYSTVSSELLELLLVPLLPQQKAENPLLYQLTATIIRSVATILLPTLNSVMSSILVGPGTVFQGKLSELADDVYPLIFELHVISPLLMTGIIPNVAVQLRADDESSRMKVCQLLGRLFLADANYARDFPRDFRELLGRNNDSSTAIRTEMVEIMAAFLSKGVEVKVVEDALASRLSDGDDEVRKSVVSKLWKVALDKGETLSPHTLEQLVDRVKDRIVDIRHQALIGSAKLFRKHVTSVLPTLQSSSFADIQASLDELPQSLQDCLRAIPGKVLKAWGLADFPTKHLVISLLQECLLPKVSANAVEGSPPGRRKSYATADLNSQRMSALLLITSLLDQYEMEFLANIMSFKAKTLSLLERAVNLKLRRDSFGGETAAAAAATSSQSIDQPSIADLKAVFQKLTNTLPNEDKKANFFDRLITSRDRSLWRLLNQCIDPMQSVDALLKSREELLKKLDSKTPLAEYMKMVFDFASYMLVPSSAVEELIVTLASDLRGSTHHAEAVLRLLVTHFPRLYMSASTSFTTWLEEISKVGTTKKGKSSQQEFLESFVFVLSKAAPCLKISETRSALLSKLLEFASEDSDAESAHLLGTAVNRLEFAQQSDSVTIDCDAARTLTGLCLSRSLSVSNDQIVNNLALLSALMLPSQDLDASFMSANLHEMKSIFTEDRRNVIANFVMNVVAKDSTLDMEIRLYSVKLLTSMFLFEDACISFHNEETNQTVVLSEVLDILFETITNKGLSILGSDKLEEDEDPKAAMECYQVATECAFSLIAVDEMRVLAVERWHELGWTLLTDNAEMQAKLVKNLVIILRNRTLHLRYLTYPCLLANNPEHARVLAPALQVAIANLRRQNGQLAEQLVAEKDEKKKANLNRFATESMPENIMPYLIHILSYHPDFPTSMDIDTDNDRRRMKSVVNCVRMLVQALQATLKVSTSNLPFLFKQLNTITTKFADRNDHENVGLHFVCRLTVRLLKDQIKTAENTQVYPGEISVPRDLYENVDVGQAQGQLAQLAGGVDVDAADSAIEKAIRLAGKSKKGSTMASPAKPRRPTASKTHAALEKKRTMPLSSTSVDEFESDLEERKPSKKAKPLPEEAPTRSLPKRGAKVAAASYLEPEEDEREVERWNKNAGITDTFSASKKSRASAGSQATKKSPQESSPTHKDVVYKTVSREEPRAEASDDFDMFQSQPIGMNFNKPTVEDSDSKKRKSSLPAASSSNESDSRPSTAPAGDETSTSASKSSRGVHQDVLRARSTNTAQASKQGADAAKKCGNQKTVAKQRTDDEEMEEESDNVPTEDEAPRRGKRKLASDAMQKKGKSLRA